MIVQSCERSSWTHDSSGITGKSISLNDQLNGTIINAFLLSTFCLLRVHKSALSNENYHNSITKSINRCLFQFLIDVYFNFTEMGAYIDAIAVSNGETIYGADVHKQQLCRRGMRRCQLCDNFEIVTISCEMKNKADVTDEFLNQIINSNNWATALEKLIEQQVSNTCNTLIDFIERE